MINERNFATYCLKNTKIQNFSSSHNALSVFLNSMSHDSGRRLLGIIIILMTSVVIACVKIEKKKCRFWSQSLPVVFTNWAELFIFTILISQDMKKCCPENCV